MPRTFSLARLLIAITLICLICGMGVNVPFLFDPLLVLFWWLPVAAITCLLASFSKQRGLLIFNALVGAIFAMALMPTLGPLLKPAYGDWDTPDLTFTIPALGALLFGGSFVLMEIHDRKSQPW